MSAPPEKKIKVDLDSGDNKIDAPKVEKECSTVSLIVGNGDCLSPVYHIKGYPWRLRLSKREDGYYNLFVRCEKSMEAEFWDCFAHIHNMALNINGHIGCRSYDKESQEKCISSRTKFRSGTQLDVEIKPMENGNKSRPIVGPFAPRDGCLVVEDTKLFVNKESLTSQSTFFERLFNGDFKEKNMTEIPIGDVSTEEFTNILKMVYGKNDSSVVDDLLTRENVDRIFELADRFDLKIVEEGVVNVLLPSTSRFSFPERLLIADKHGLSMCKDRIIRQSSSSDLRVMSTSPEYGQLSMETKDDLFRQSCGTYRN